MFEALKQTFPAGTVSGAPKVRAIEVIDEMEEHARGPYAGCVGYIGFDGSLDMAITIRTAIFDGETGRGCRRARASSTTACPKGNTTR